MSVDGVQFQTGTQKHRLLLAYAQAPLFLRGLNDWEAAKAADLLYATYWMRCHELREAGLIEITMEGPHLPLVRSGKSGLPRMVCAITEDGKKYLAKLKEEAE